MKLFILSDIHGSYSSFKKAMEQYDKLKCSKLLLLGDILYHGPRNPLPEGHDVKSLITALNLMRDSILCVKGNCDAEVDQMVLDFPIEDRISLFVNNREVVMTHGHHINPSSPLDLKKNGLVLFGHSHVPYFDEVNNVYYFNPGSISLPKENSLRGYGVLENDTLCHYDIDGNLLNKWVLNNE